MATKKTRSYNQSDATVSRVCHQNDRDRMKRSKQLQRDREKLAIEQLGKQCSRCDEKRSTQLTLMRGHERFAVSTMVTEEDFLQQLGDVKLVCKQCAGSEPGA